ncbi:MAG TPA: hypothetical protein VL096_21325, partial [Pirellulaceae bacterium]|nr:hypothetical protein [Pirellulaceae bacterium]
PQLGRRDLYQRYDFNQPWDSPTNMMLVSNIPDVYIAPGDDSARASFETSYLVVMGKETVFRTNGKSMSRDDINDGAGSTILVVESAESGICWLEPKDPTASGMNYNINGAPSGCIRSKHPAGASVVFADGKTHFLPNDLAPEHVEAFLTARKRDEAPLELLND